MRRRDFIKSTAALAAATVVGGRRAEADDKPEQAGIRQYRPLGSTGLTMSDISFGAGQLEGASLVLRAVDRGITYFDTAPDYGNSEKHLGEALQRLKKRDSVIIASKFCRPLPYQAGVSHRQLGTTEAEYIESVEGSLTRLGTDYLDICFVHAIGELEDTDRERKRLLDPEMLGAVEKLKKAGKIRFLAVSSHGPHGMEGLLTDAVESGHFDVIMPAFNFMSFPELPKVLAKAKAKGVGVVAMKTLAGAKKMDLDPGDESFEQAAFKWVLKHPEVAGLIVTIKNTGHLRDYVQASGQKFAARDQQVLDRYAARFGTDYCRTGCGVCEPSCPYGVRIASVLRYQMYFADYGAEKRAMEKYAALDGDASRCATCSDQPCANACPHGLAVGHKLGRAHLDLSFRA